MNNDDLNPNFEWKKKSFGKKEHSGRGFNQNQAALIEAQKKNEFSSAIPLTAPTPLAANLHLQKMRKTIKQAVDEDDDEEEDTLVLSRNPLLDDEMNSNPLFQGLSEPERRLLRQKQTLREIRLQQDAAKLHALVTANTFAKKNGIPSLSAQDIAETMQNNGWEKETFRRTLEHHLAPDIKIGFSKINPEKVKKLLKGLKRLQRIGGISAVRGMKMNEVIRLTDKKFNDKKIAQMLLKKTGRKLDLNKDKKLKKNKYPQKISFKKLLQKQQQERQPLMKA